MKRAAIQPRYQFPFTPPPPPSGLPRFGVATGSVIQTWSQATLDFAMGKLVELAQGKPFAVRFDISTLDATATRNVDACLANDLTPYIVPYDTTSPISPSSLPTQIASHYAGAGMVYCGPNEPDLHAWGHDQLATFQIDTFNQVKAADPSCLCGFGALWKGSGINTGAQSLTGYIQSFIALAATKADFISFHGYDDPLTHADWDIWDWWFPGGFYPDAQTMKIILANGGVNVPIISDECGGNIAAGEAGQAADVQALLQQVGGRVTSLFIFSLLKDNDPNWYIINDDHTVRQAYTTMKNWIAAH